MTSEEAYLHAGLAGLDGLAVLRAGVSSLDSEVHAVKVFGMVNVMPEFAGRPEVINGRKDLFVEVFGERGRPARSAVGTGALPFGITVEIEAIFEVT